MIAGSVTLSERDQVRLGPALLMPSCVSLLAALLAWALAASGIVSGWPLAIVTGLQAVLTLLGAAAIAGTQAAALRRWQRRVAPSAAQTRVRGALRSLLAHLAARAVVGPLLLAAVLAWMGPAGAALEMAVLALLALALALAAGALAGWRLAQRDGPPWAAWQRRFGWRRWRRVPTLDEIDQPWRGRGGMHWVWLAFLPQAVMQAPMWRAHAWGHALPTGWPLAWAALWMAVLGVLANAALVGPPLHWRARLAPGGMGPLAWARRMVAGSVLSSLAWASAALGLSMVFSTPELRAQQLSAWAPLAGDVALAASWVLWLRGRHNGGARPVWAALALGGGTVLLLWAAASAGVTLQRGGALLAAELLLAGALALAAQRAWARQDLNALA